MSLGNIPVILKTQCRSDRYISIISKHFTKDRASPTGDGGQPAHGGAALCMGCGLEVR